MYDKYRGFESLSIQRLCGGMVYTLDLKSSASAYGFKSHHSQCPVAQLVERLSDKQEVIGSIPIRTINSVSLIGRATSFEVGGYRFKSYIEQLVL